jgi:hypothetical protein
MTRIDFYVTEGIGKYFPKIVLDVFFKENIKPSTVSVKNDLGQVICAANVKTIKHSLRTNWIPKNMFSRIRLFKTKKNYRLDLNLWETQFMIKRITLLSRYEIFKDGKLRTHYRLFITSPSTARYLPPTIPETKIYIGRKELQEKYQGNKWLVPINRHYNENLQ